MIYPAADKLDAMPSKYALVIVAAKRARQLKEGARRMVDTRSTNALTIALEELAFGEITPLLVGEPEPMPTSLAATPVLTGLVATSIDDDDPLHESAAAKIGALLTPGDDIDDFESDLEDDLLHADGEALETEDAVDDSPFGIDGAEPDIELDADSSSDDMAVDETDLEEDE